MLNPFLDQRKIPEMSINCKIKVKTKSADESNCWNSFFAYLMKKPKTKVEFVTVSIIRGLPISNITVEDIKPHLQQEDYDRLLTISDIFDTRLPIDLKAFILSLLQVPISSLTK